MKKISKILVISLLALVMVIAMAACGGAKPSGKFVLDEFSVKVGEVEISGKISELEDKLEELEEELEPGELLGLSIMLAMFSNFSLTFDGDNLIAKMGVLTV
ncbi:MAG: hypothetical protein FWG51_03425, partial [Firmicutes bacterium]|nr:hypothetical protein [Bacillota bacterium]